MKINRKYLKKDYWGDIFYISIDKSSYDFDYEWESALKHLKEMYKICYSTKDINKADIVLFYGNWQKSDKCRKDMLYALNNNLKIKCLSNYEFNIYKFSRKVKYED